MFLRSEIQSSLDVQASLAHTASVLAPYTFDIRPSGFRPTEPNYRVVVERAAFALRATVVPDYLAVAVVAAIVAGARNNPARMDRLRDALAERGWTPDIELSPERFTLQAVNASIASLDDDGLVEVGLEAAVLLSEFVLDQFVVTRRYGELRPAVERPIGDTGEAEVWLYDPSERDRSTQVHRALENWLMISLRARHVEPLDPAGEPFFDLAWRSGPSLVICEVKSTRNSEDHQLRLGLGQVLQYAALIEKSGSEAPRAALLIEAAPRDSTWVDVCNRAGVTLFWPDIWPEVAERIAIP